MQHQMLKCKIHRAVITEANLDYEGSLTIDKKLMDKVGLLPFERVHIYNINNGERFETYVITGTPGSGIFCLNGAAARKGMVGDLIIVVSYGLYAEEELQNYQPKIVVLNPDNSIAGTGDCIAKTDR